MFVGVAVAYHAVQVCLIGVDERVYWAGVSELEASRKMLADLPVDGASRVHVLEPFNTTEIAETVHGGMLVCACEELGSFAIIKKLISLGSRKNSI
mgnify:CR=1 FL=1